MTINVFFIMLLLNFNATYSFSFNINNVTIITPGMTKHSYFAYTLLLQSDDNGSVLIVGAPKAKRRKGILYVNALYACPLYGRFKCSRIINVLVIVVLMCISQTKTYSLNVTKVQVIYQDSVKNTYFSYNLLLQASAGSSALVISAPKGDSQKGGDLYRCDLSADGIPCALYPLGRLVDTHTPNGNFLGMSLDGDSNVGGPLIACAPRSLSPDKANYLRGYCAYLRNSSDFSRFPENVVPVTGAGKDADCCDETRKSYYDLAFAMAGFDVCYYSKDEILFGAPGVKKFNGASITYSLDSPRIVNPLPDRSHPKLKDEDSYFGYSVTAAQFRRDSPDVWYVSGAPKASDLKGKVTVYFYDVSSREKTNVVYTFEGEEPGSYFGAAILASDVTNDGVVDILVGAPMSGGLSYDEGVVYFYRGLSERSFLRPKKLTGSRKMRSRFGTRIVSLGDFDLDGYNDVAISAPYENDGVGAVYIYRGSVEGLHDQYSQKISPSDIPQVSGVLVEGFGLGMSRGNDIDGNGHNDIAIGAYKTDQVFVIKSQTIVDYQTELYTSINSITNDTTNFLVDCCILCTERSDKKTLTYVDFVAGFDMDYRIDMDMYRTGTSELTVPLRARIGKRSCHSFEVPLRVMALTDISPLAINLRLSVEPNNIVAHGESSIDLKIPYSHGCGDDNVCNTDLSLELHSVNLDDLVLGYHKNVDIKATAGNSGDPAYNCHIKLIISDELELRNAKDCVKTDANYSCPLNGALSGHVEKTFIFDVKDDISPNTQAVSFHGEIVCSGQNSPNSQFRSDLQVPVVLNSVPYMSGKSVPENMVLQKNLEDDSFYVESEFSVGKKGPSPLRLNVDLLIPRVQYDEKDVFEIMEVEGRMENSYISCVEYADGTVNDNVEDSNIVLNRTVLVKCSPTINCRIFTCKDEFLYNSGQLAVFKVKTRIHTDLLAKAFHWDISKGKDMIAFLPVAYQANDQAESVRKSSLFLIFVQSTSYVPLWIYLVATIVGIGLLTLIAYGLYKCHFFDRIYKDKLEQEKSLLTLTNGVRSDSPSFAVIVHFIVIGFIINFFSN